MAFAFQDPQVYTRDRLGLIALQTRPVQLKYIGLVHIMQMKDRQINIIYGHVQALDHPVEQEFKNTITCVIKERKKQLKQQKVNVYQNKNNKSGKKNSDETVSQQLWASYSWLSLQCKNLFSKLNKSSQRENTLKLQKSGQKNIYQQEQSQQSQSLLDSRFTLYTYKNKDD